MIRYMLIAAVAAVAGWLINEHATADHVSRALHSIESATQTMAQDRLALEGHLESFVQREEHMMLMTDQLLSLVELQNQVAQSTLNHYNTKYVHDNQKRTHNQNVSQLESSAGLDASTH